MKQEAKVLLQIDHMRKSFDGLGVLKDISLCVREGEVVSMIGANGAGKTTTLHTISGLKRPTSGQVTFQGQDITKTPAQNIARLGICQIPAEQNICHPDKRIVPVDHKEYKTERFPPLVAPLKIVPTKNVFSV